MVFLRLDNLKIHIILTPFIKICDLVHRKDLRVAPEIVEIQVQIVAINSEDIADSHAVD